MRNKLLWFLLTLLGFGTSCSDNENENYIPGKDDVCLYGTPSATFSVKGKVTDEESKPIPGIDVRIRYDDEGKLTDEQGNFVFSKSRTFSIGKDPMPLVFTDIDGPENGSFEQTTANVQFTQNPDVKPDSWYQGDFTAEDVTVVMKRAAEETTIE